MCDVTVYVYARAIYRPGGSSAAYVPRDFSTRRPETLLNLFVWPHKNSENKSTVVHVWSACYIDDGTFAAVLYGSQTTSSSRVNCIYDDLITDGNSLPVITAANSSYGPRNPTGTRIGAPSVYIYPATTFTTHQMILSCRPSCVYLCTTYTLSWRSRRNIIARATGWEDRRFY